MSDRLSDDLEIAERIPGEAARLLDIAAERSLTLRLTGSLAVRLRCPEHGALLSALGRRPYRDIDFFGYTREQRHLEQLFVSEGYEADPTIRQSQEWGIKRLIYTHPDTHIKIDVFMDELVMAHTVKLVGRLELDEPTVTLTDLLLSKLQIHEITENDLIDLTVLLAEHGFGLDANQGIDLDYIAGIMARDWGFCYETFQNIDKHHTALTRYATLPDHVAEVVRERLDTLRQRIDEEPKSTRWKLRARLGTRAPWYEEVDEVER